MSTETDESTIELELSHPDGQLRIQAPVDIPLGELMNDFLDVCHQPDDGTDWALSDGVTPYPAERSLSEIGVEDGVRMVLAPDPRTPMPAASNRRSDEPTPTSEPSDTGRPLTEKTIQALPKRLTMPARVLTTLGALRLVQQRPERTVALDTPDPATFMRRAPVSPVARVRTAWTATRYQSRLENRILSVRLQRCATIAVLSPKGGVGKTTITALIGSMLAHLRRDRVVAVDTNSDWGSLGRRLVPDHPVFIDNLLSGPLRDGQLSPIQLDAELGRGPDGLMVAPAPTDKKRVERLDRAAYETLFRRLRELVGTLVLDCGTGLNSPPAQAALACADQLVVVSDDEPDSASLVSEAANSELTGRTTPVVLVVNNLRRTSRIDVAALERAIPFAAGCVTVPHDKPAAATLHGSQLSWRRAPNLWQTPVSELAALLVSSWRRLEIAH